MATTPEDIIFMEKALTLAARGWGRTSPNPMVGAVVVKEGRVVGEGYHQYAGGPHAEVYALQEAGDQARSATLYVTLEPCSHTGRTPPCTQAILKAGIGRVVSAMQDPNPLVAGSGHHYLEENGIVVDSGLCAARARILNEIFVKHIVTKQPFVAIKCAATMDGRLATSSGSSQWITGAQAREHVHHLRHGYDAILVGIGTVLADNPSLTTRLPHGQGRHPLRVVLDTHLRIAPQARLLQVQNDSGTVIYTGPQADRDKIKTLEEQGHTVVQLRLAQNRVAFDQVIRDLGRRGITSVLVEGGGGIIGSALHSGLTDKIYVYYGPLILGGDDGVPICRGKGPARIDESITIYRRSTSTFGDDILIEGYLTPN